MGIDHLAYSSGWRDTAPAFKGLLAVVTLITCIASPAPLSHLLVLLSMTALILGKGKVPLRSYLHLLTLPAAFLAVGSIGIAVSIGRELPANLPHLQLGGFFLFVTPDGMLAAARLALKSFGAVSCLYFLILSTPVRDITALLYRLKLPGVLVEQMMLVYRFIFLLGETAQTKMQSARCRHAFRSLRRIPRDTGTLWGAVFVQSLDNGQRIFDAMRARGYDTPGCIRMLEQPAALTAKSISLVLLFEAIIIAVNFI